MNSSINHSYNTNNSTTPNQAHLSELAIHEVEGKESLSIPIHGQVDEGFVKSTNKSSGKEMAKENDRNIDTLTVTDNQPLNSSESKDLDRNEIDTPNQDNTIVRQHPIAPPSEPKQYRAIGLVRGRYQPSTEQFTRGNLQTPDGSEIDAVLLGRVMSLLKNHLDLEEEHLWVVYPRTRQENDDLHIQIMGVWEPETLRKIKNTESKDEKQDNVISSLTISPTAEDNQSEEIPQTSEDIDNYQQTTIVTDDGTQTDSLLSLNDGYFSIRGEVIYQSQEEEYIIVRVKQSPRKDEDTPRFFKLKLKGNLGDRPLNRFWDLHIKRQDTFLVIQYANDIGSLFVNNRRKPPFKGRKTFNDNRRSNYSRRPTSQSYNSANSAPTRKEPIPKPTKKNKNADE
ncbi:hypothetical protein [Okeania sp. SIO2B3]|uniref:hypothetical protein n=1 Tax=Okeania sp. SIO2B3 TaxID=2607784 RepID=UPI0013C08859|nr:hypothetical protein [Okeania sp. SIO2B3]NET41037.1 hypothetical protein [Okeania sp. SIO2B3]